ncbi:(d)CMP kinase [Planctomicrobium sp. SH661]|uniref:(d)CMP kinase n=1 Tax=Planctomicrobium sp. SH661 TaxID=3448124 RepID=UPI003F5BD0C5
MIVTIDGPAGTGKSTVARRLAEQLGFQFLDTGSMYRMIALRTLSAELNPEDHIAIASLTARSRMELVNGRILLDGEDVGGSLRTPEVTRMASLVAQIPRVREQLVQRQRDIANASNVVCEGRDQGTVAFPHAEYKFFLTAQAEERARRRQLELEAQGETVDFQALLQEQKLRDQRDQERSVAPLKPAPDAVVIDTTTLSLDEVVQLLHDRIRQQRQVVQMQQ